MFSKQSIKKFYNDLLRIIQQFIGDRVTDSKLLNRLGGAIFLTKWKGVFAHDEQYPSKGYCIVNLDNSDEPGSHWVAVANGHVYDSFGRCNLLKKGACAGDGIADQKDSETNCGQRSMAWLCVHQACGLEGANLV
jgi:hypothetical protein